MFSAVFASKLLFVIVATWVVAMGYVVLKEEPIMIDGVEPVLQVAAAVPSMVSKAVTAHYVIARTALDDAGKVLSSIVSLRVP